MTQDFIASCATVVKAPVTKVWEALVTPAAIKQYMFGTNVASGWKEGSAISWKGEWQGRPYEDKGKILELKPGRRLRYTHFSPLSGVPDTPDNYHTVTIDLSSEGSATRVALSQDKNATDEARKHSETNWTMMLAALKKYLEG